MAAGEPQQPDHDNRTQRKRARLAAWSQVIGAVLVIVTLTCTLLNVISAQQAVALGLPAVLLILGGLIAAAAIDPSSTERRAFRAGLRVGNLLRRLQAALRRRVGS